MHGLLSYVALEFIKVSLNSIASMCRVNGSVSCSILNVFIGSSSSWLIILWIFSVMGFRICNFLAISIASFQISVNSSFIYCNDTNIFRVCNAQITGRRRERCVTSLTVAIIKSSKWFTTVIYCPIFCLCLWLVFIISYYSPC